MSKQKEPPISTIVTTIMLIAVAVGATMEIIRSLGQTIDFMTLALRGPVQGTSSGIVVQFFQQYAILRYNRARGRKWMWATFFAISLALDAGTNIGQWARSGIPPTNAGTDPLAYDLAVIGGFVWCILVCFFEEFVSGMIAIIFHNLNEIIVALGGEKIEWLEWAEELARDITPGGGKRQVVVPT